MTETVWKGAEQLRGVLVPVDSIVTHPKNPRRGKVVLIAESLQRFGQVRPILLDDDNTITAGNHTYLAAKELGWTHVAAVSNKFASPDEARAYLLADNRLGELGDYAGEQQLALLEELEASGSWAGTGYTPDDMEDLRAAHGTVPTTEQEAFAGGYAVDPEELAARTQHLAAGRTMTEVVLPLVGSIAGEFEQHRKILAKEYGGSGSITEVVLRAVEEQAARL